MIERSPASGPTPGADPTEPVEIALVAGCGHSGSTLLSLALDGHPEVLGVGEMHAPRHPVDRPDERLCSCGRRMGDCPFYAGVARRLRSEGVPLDPARWDLRYRPATRGFANRMIGGPLGITALERVRDRLVALVPSLRRERADLLRLNERFVRAALAEVGKRVFLDASKNPIRIPLLCEVKGFRLKVIHLVRDPRGYGHSRMRDRGDPPERVAAGWLRVNGNVERYLTSLPRDRWLRLRYEALCEDPSSVLGELSAFLEVRADAVPADLRSNAHHVLGNKMRLLGSEPLHIRLDEAWRLELPPVQAEVIWRRCAPRARRYGYRD